MKGHSLFIFTALIALGTLTVQSGLALGPELKDPCRQVEEAARIASRLRGLKLKKPIACLTLDDEAFANQGEGEPESRLDSEEIAYKMLGVIPDDYSYAECIFTALQAEAEALYDARGNAIKLSRTRRLPMSTLAHEAVHALQAQNFPRLFSASAAKLTSDQYLARLALIEGDAAWVEHRYQDESGRLEEPDSEAFKPQAELGACRFPRALENIYDSAYSVGELFVEIIRRQGGQASLDAFFLDPPSSTKLLLQALSSKDKRLESAAPAKRSTGPQGSVFFPGPPVFKDVMGALSIQAFLKAWMPRAQAVLAAKGWSADFLSLYRNPDNPHEFELLWTSDWESDRDSRRFFEALRDIWQKRLNLELDARSQDFIFSNSEWRHLRLARRQTQVQLLVVR